MEATTLTTKARNTLHEVVAVKETVEETVELENSVRKDMLYVSFIAQSLKI